MTVKTSAKIGAKEYIEIHFDEKTVVIDDYKSIIGHGLQIDEIKTSTSNKGQSEELLALHESLRSDKVDWPIGLEDLIKTTWIALMIGD